MKVADAMTSEVEVVGPEASLKEVASILAEHRISGLPVVDDGGDVLGVISEGDILLKETAEVPRGFQRLRHIGKQARLQARSRRGLRARR